MADPASPGGDRVLADSRGAVRILTLNRPEKLNAADPELQRRLLERVEEVATDPEVGALILTGSGRGFCSGGDFSVLERLAEGAPELQKELGEINRGLLYGLLGLEIPVIAAVNGPAVGFGAAMVALCDIVVMADGAYLCEPHVRYGLAASPAIQLIWPCLTSRALAKELLMTGRRVTASEAVRLGLANHAVPQGEELSASLAIAEELMALPHAGVAAVKRAFNEPLIEQAKREEATRPPPSPQLPA